METVFFLPKALSGALRKQGKRSCIVVKVLSTAA